MAEAGTGSLHRSMLNRFIQRGRYLCGRRKPEPAARPITHTSVIGFPNEDVPEAVEAIAARLARQLEEKLESSCPGTGARCIVMVLNPARSRS